MLRDRSARQGRRVPKVLQEVPRVRPGQWGGEVYQVLRVTEVIPVHKVQRERLVLPARLEQRDPWAALAQ